MPLQSNRFVAVIMQTQQHNNVTCHVRSRSESITCVAAYHVYGDQEIHDVVRRNCMDYMVRGDQMHAF